ncbi:methyltransferase domain-containing protein [Balneolales bacterium ANBcel1]|nr:methyltransferase domain-containing protein [Balneolales bacterium ANBcel1]
MITPLTQRQSELVEWMDRPDCNPELLRNTYRHFSTVNEWISGWRDVYLRLIRPELVPGKLFRLLDVGSGGGDITKKLWKWARNDGFTLDVTGIDPDPRALAFSSEHIQPHNYPGLRFVQTDTSGLLHNNIKFDFVVSNHVLHHLKNREVAPFLNGLSQLASRRVICSDIERSSLGYFLFSALTLPLFNDSYIRTDGLISIKKSFTCNELMRIAPSGWTVRRQFPFRLLAIYDTAASKRSSASSPHPYRSIAAGNLASGQTKQI